MNRRALLRFTALSGAFMATQASTCSTGTPTVSQFAQYATVALNAASEALTAITNAAPSLIPAPTLATVTSYLNEVKAASAALAAGAASAGASWQQQLYDGIKAVLPVAAPLLSVIPGAGLGLAALQAVLPIVASWLGLTGAASTVGVPGIPAMTQAQAVKLYGAGPV
jgi:hypothetical protein